MVQMHGQLRAALGDEYPNEDLEYDLEITDLPPEDPCHPHHHQDTYPIRI